jgi:hypothetical protein
MINLDLSLSQYHEKPTTLPSGLRSYRHTARFKQPSPVGLHGDLLLLASLDPTIDLEQLAKADEQRKAGTFLRDKLKTVDLSAFHQRVLALLQAEDAEYHQRNKAPVDMTNIFPHRGKYRVATKEEGKTKWLSFPTLEEAVKCRNRLRMVPA